MAAIDIVDIVSGLYAFLTDDNAFNTALGGDGSNSGRLSFIQAQKGETYPYAVYHWIDMTSDPTTMQSDGYDCTFQFDLYESEAAGPRACMDIADALRAVLNRATYTVTNHEQMAAEMNLEIAPTLEDESWRMICDYRVAGFRT